MTAPARFALRQYFGFPDFKPGQREVIEHLLAGRSAAAVFPTGGGKSVCYQLPALLLPGLTLVVSPLIALMKDQIDALRAREIRASRLDSTLDVDQYRAVMEQVRSGSLRLLYVAPERFLNERFCEAIRGVRYRYRLQRKPDDPAALVRKLTDRLFERESREIGRLGAVAQWVERDGCQVAALGTHFAEPMDRRCGHCSWCLRGGKPSPLPPRPPATIDDAVWTKALALREEYAEELGEPRALARFLCGVSSPGLVRAKLQTHSLFGSLGHVPFRAVLGRIR